MNSLIPNNNHFPNIQNTVDGVKDYWRALQFKPQFEEQLQPFEGRI